MSGLVPPYWLLIDVDELVAQPSDMTDGPFGSQLKSEHYTDEGPRVVRLQNIGDGSFIDAKATISQAHFQSLAKHSIASDDVLVAMLGEYLPRACLAPATLGPAVVKADCVRLRVDPRLATAGYVAAGLNSEALRSQTAKLRHGVGRPRLGLGLFRGLKFPLAPLAEQPRIVEALDSYLSRLDAAAASLERAQAKLKAYRTSVLKAAVEGRLVPTEAELARQEGRDYEPASVLLDRILVQRRRRWEESELARLTKAGKPPKDEKWKAKYEEPAKPDLSGLPELPEGWCWTTVAALLREPLRNGHSARERSDGNGVRTLTLSAVTQGDFSARNTKVTSADPTKVGDLWLTPGDIFVERANTPELVGTAAIYLGPRNFAIFPDLLVRVRCVELVSAPYINIVLASWMARSYFRRCAQGIAGSMPKIDQQAIESLAIPLPPAREQQRIADDFDRLGSAQLACVNDMRLSRIRIAKLRQSILKWAFEGRLVDPDPNDEPAEQLLARIRAERAVASAAPKKSRARTAKAKP